MSPDVLNLLAVILGQQSLSASDPNFDAAAALIGKARRELIAELQAIEVETAKIQVDQS